MVLVVHYGHRAAITGLDNRRWHTRREWEKAGRSGGAETRGGGLTVVGVGRDPLE